MDPKHSGTTDRNQQWQQIYFNFSRQPYKIQQGLLSNQEAATIVKEFVTKIIFEHVIPDKKVSTDQGTNF